MSRQRIFNFAFVAAVVMVALTGVAQGTTVMGVDLGTEFIKVCASKGNAIDIVLNEQTRRKSNNYLGFRGDDRYFGEDARNLAARFPANMFASISRLIGLGYDNPEDQVFINHYKEILQLPYAIGNETRRGSLTLSTLSNPNVTYSVEELMAMMWTHLKDITLKDREITDRNHPIECTVTVPAYWNLRMRQALVDAASIVGVKVNSQLHPTTATALQFGMQHQGFGNETKNAIILDVGSAKTEVGIFTFTEAELGEGEKRPKLAHSMGTMTTRFIGSDPTLGGRNWDHCIAQELERQFAAKYPKLPTPLNGKTSAQWKSTFSLMRAANQLKETMSANAAATPVTVEGMAPDRDFATKMKREEFEQLCAPLFERVVKVVKTAVEESGLTMDDINRFELMGGGSRIPKLIEDMNTLYGKPVDRTLNTDEAAAWGAAYYAARLTGFRVRSFKVVEKAAVNLDVVLSARKDAVEDENSRKPAPRTFFGQVIPGSSKSLTVKRSDDYTIYLQDKNTKRTFATVDVTGVNSALEVMNALQPPVEHENNTHVTRVELKFGDNYVISASEATVKVSLVHNVSKRVKVEVNNTDESAAANNESASSDEATKTDGESDADAEKKADDSATDGDSSSTEGADATADANATDANATATNKKKVKKVWTNIYKLELKRSSRNLIVKTTFHDTPAPMSSDDLAAAKATLAGLEALDEAKRMISQAKNDLETYLHSIKTDGLLDNAEIQELKLMNDEQKAAIEEAAARVQEWVEDGEGSYDSATAEMFNEQLQELKKACAPVEEPYQEHKRVQLEALRNATETRKKEKEEAKKKAKAEKRAEQRAKEEAEKKKADEEAGKASAEEDSEGTEGSDEGKQEEPKQQEQEEKQEEEKEL